MHDSRKWCWITMWRVKVTLYCFLMDSVLDNWILDMILQDTDGGTRASYLGSPHHAHILINSHSFWPRKYLINLELRCCSISKRINSWFKNDFIINDQWFLSLHIKPENHKMLMMTGTLLLPFYNFYSLQGTEYYSLDWSCKL